MGSYTLAIRCNVCGMVSYHPGDVASRYCGNCRLFHETASPEEFAGAMLASGIVGRESRSRGGGFVGLGFGHLVGALPPIRAALDGP